MSNGNKIICVHLLIYYKLHKQYGMEFVIIFFLYVVSYIFIYSILNIRIINIYPLLILPVYFQ